LETEILVVHSATGALRTFNSVSVQPSLVPEKTAQRPGDLPTCIPLSPGSRRSGEPQHLAAQLDELPVAVAGIVVYLLALKLLK
jgi:hypothetical protein